MSSNISDERESGCGVVTSRLLRLTLAAILLLAYSDAYVFPPIQKYRNSFTQRLSGGALQSSSSSATSSGTGFGVVEDLPAQTQPEKSNIPEEILSLSAQEIKRRLVDLLPRMTGKAEEFRQVEGYINVLEKKYIPVQTLSFLNLAMGGEWQLLFSTNRLGVPNTKLRLRELVQRVETKNFEGTVTNLARWDLAEDGEAFDATGTFSVNCSYKINQGARMTVVLDEHVLQPSRGSKIPKDVPALVGMLHRAMPSELFDPNDLAMDTTYLDADIRIVRLTGSRLDGVRNVFIRNGAVEINPTKE